MSNKLKKLFLSLLIFTIIAVILFFTLGYFQSRKTIRITFENITKIELVEFRTLKPISVIKNSGDNVTINKNTRYKLVYKAKDGYESGNIAVDNEQNTIDIKPYYSIEKLDSLLTDADVATIHSLIKNSYDKSTLDQYNIEKGRLYHYGYWYSTSLVYKQNYNDVSDTLHIIAKKSAQGWEIVADPSITFDRLNNPSVPIDILQSINAK